MYLFNKSYTKYLLPGLVLLTTVALPSYKSHCHTGRITEKDSVLQKMGCSSSKNKVSMIHDEDNQRVGETKTTDSFTATLHLFILL